jgi:hypothetical protein
LGKINDKTTTTTTTVETLHKSRIRVKKLRRAEKKHDVVLFFARTHVHVEERGHMKEGCDFKMIGSSQFSL